MTFRYKVGCFAIRYYFSISVLLSHSVVTDMSLICDAISTRVQPFKSYVLQSITTIHGDDTLFLVRYVCLNSLFTLHALRRRGTRRERRQILKDEHLFAQSHRCSLECNNTLAVLLPKQNAVLRTLNQKKTASGTKTASFSDCGAPLIARQTS